MKRIIYAIIGVLSLLAATANPVRAIDGLTINAQGTNVIVSWLSPGQWQNYVVQYRPDLNPGTPWTTLLFNTQPGIADNYAANSQTVTTYTNYGAIPISTGGGSGGSTNPPPMPTLVAISSEQAASMGESALLDGGLDDAIPLFLYPPGFDTSDMEVFETLLPGVPESESLQSDEALSAAGIDSQSLMVGGVAQSATTTTVAPMGFYRVFQKPDFYYDYAGVTFNLRVQRSRR
jgi:hypothetical protein